MELASFSWLKNLIVKATISNAGALLEATGVE